MTVFSGNPRDFTARPDWGGCDGAFARQKRKLKEHWENLTPKQKQEQIVRSQAKAANTVRPNKVAGVSLARFSWDEE